MAVMAVKAPQREQRALDYTAEVTKRAPGRQRPWRDHGWRMAACTLPLGRDGKKAAQRNSAMYFTTELVERTPQIAPSLAKLVQSLW